MERLEAHDDWKREGLGEGLLERSESRVNQPGDADHDRALWLEQASRELEQRYRYTIALSPLVVWTAWPNGDILDIDEAGLARTGLSMGEVRGQGFFAAVHPDDRQSVAMMWRRNASLGHPIDNEVRMRMRDGSYRWHRSRAAPLKDASGKILRWYGTIEDIHDRKLAADAVRWAADHDSLTGIWARAAFLTGLERAVERAAEAGSVVALMLFDLDNFKQVNDRFGHDTGDALLKDVAVRLSGAAEEPAMVGRLGGDEFALYLARPDSARLAAAIDRAVAALDTPFRYGAITYHCRSSIGVAFYPADGADGDTLRKNADLALYDAKAEGGGTLCYFRGELRLQMQQRLSMLSIARDALDRDLILPYYQPKIELGTGRIAGFEALLRWSHPGRGVQLPATIAVAFDDPELAIALGERMQEKVFADIRGWRERGLDTGRIAINASAMEFRGADFAAKLIARLAAFDVPATCIELEITEGVFFDNSDAHVRRTISTLHDAGITIALDDFGTGYASLAHLRQFPVDVLKIDRSFVQAPTACDWTIVRAIIGLGKGLGIKTVAEGVETNERRDALLNDGCDFAQGYLFSPPVASTGVVGLLEAERAR
ncbi:EAL domain-containing protein [Sphingomonas sp. H39-1-10]|uniref:putative bifunctional diguanylate cyclase/phosphodiesterase n=1 Tax=Sphingomonas pollutisoli TaxID=3030829 RepID=UPI0023B989EE|nr:EAL domain-containing protein [Sphingomonas pollutisoli]MDF0487319.1 EAL domain-containing protein [Sphingomonas pollutisoli]